jgi:hypothetical protein
MDDLLLYYLLKRIFIFFDEWLFYCVLYILLVRGHYHILPFIIIFGFSCIYTSYYNINLIEKELLDIDQKIFLYHGSIINIIENMYDNLLDYI